MAGQSSIEVVALRKHLRSPKLLNSAIAFRAALSEVCLRDKMKARRLKSDSTYERVQAVPGEEEFDSQAHFASHTVAVNSVQIISVHKPILQISDHS